MTIKTAMSLWPRALGIAVLYYILEQIGQFFLIRPEGFSIVSPACGFLLAVLLLTERKSWPFTMVAVFISIIITNLHEGNSSALSIGYAFAESLEAFVEVMLLQRFVGKEITFNTVREVFGFVLVAVLVSNFLTTSLVAFIPTLAMGTSYWRTWLTWFIEEGVSLLLTTPLIIALVLEKKNIFKKANQWLFIEFLVLLGVIMAIIFLSFGLFPWQMNVTIRPSLAILPLIWITIRCGLVGATTATFLFAMFSVIFTKYGMGPFIEAEQDYGVALISQQLFLGTISFAMLILSASIMERRQASISLQKSVEKYRLLTENAKDMIYRYEFGPKLGYTYVSPAATKMTGFTPDEHYNDPYISLKLVHPEDRPRLKAASLADNKSGESTTLRFIRKDGELVWIELQNVYILDSTGKLIAIEGIARNITERKMVEAEIRHAMAEKVVMMQEIHHRVKNNMQIIDSLLGLQSTNITDPLARVILEESRNRVKSMSLIHEHLYQSSDLTSIDFQQYLNSITAAIARTYLRNDVVMSVEMQPLILDMKVAVPCGLIVNELTSNCLKYAFPEGRKGTIKIGIYKNEKGHYVLSVADNGIGFPPTVDFRNTTSLGLQLVNILTQQLRGTIELSKTEGTKITIVFA